MSLEVKEKNELNFSTPEELLDYVSTIPAESKEKLFQVLDILGKDMPKEFLAQLVAVIAEKYRDPQLDLVSRDWYSRVKSKADRSLGRLPASDQRYLDRQKTEHRVRKPGKVDFGNE